MRVAAHTTHGYWSQDERRLSSSAKRYGIPGPFPSYDEFDEHDKIHAWALGCIYAIRAEVRVGRLIKIGWSNGNPAKRIKDLQIGSPVPLEFLGCIGGSVGMEKRCHSNLQHIHSHGEWFHECEELAMFVDCFGPYDEAVVSQAKSMPQPPKYCEWCAKYEDQRWQLRLKRDQELMLRA